MREQLGGEAITIPGRDVAEELIRHAESNNVAHIVVGARKGRRWWHLFQPSVTEELIRRAGNISVHVVSGTAKETSLDGRGVKTAAAPTP